MKKNIVIFAGAGASKAVNPSKFPTTVEFFKNLPDQITNNNMFKLVLDFLYRNTPDRVVDIEEILWELQELINFSTNLKNRQGIVAYSIYQNFLAQYNIVPNHNINIFHTIQETVLGKCTSLVSEINKEVYNYYSYEPKETELIDNWSYLFNKIDTTNKCLDIFTTNYDLSIETAVSHNKDIDDGFLGYKGQRKLSLDLQKWKKPKANNGLLTKLHGSVDWQWKNEEILVGASIYTGNHDNHAIIYPGFKGQSDTYFFSPLHEYLGNRLDSADLIIFVGFAFRDEYINELLRERVDHRNTKIVVINPDKKIKYPINTGNPNYIHAGFDKNSINTALLYLNKQRS